MKKIEDYLKHYIGCDVMLRDDLNFRSDGNNHKLLGLYPSEVEPFKTIALIDSPWRRFYRAYIEDIKLLLRPLSSMTEEEAKELCKMQIRGFRENEDVVSIITMIPTVKFIIHHKDDPESQIIFNIRRYLNIDSYTPSQFLYLTQHGFDILNLIDTGIALDATKIEKV